MSRKKWILGASVLGCIAITATFLPAMLHGNDARQTPRANKLIVHEWGTFTSFAGSDGVNLEYRPLVTNDLPRFIMTPFNQPGTPSSLLLKSTYTAFQRMETPVTYFYTDVPRTVNVRVDFPKGMLTEWYPVVKQFESGKPDEKRAMGKAFLDWGPVRLTPQEQFADVRVKIGEGKSMPAKLPPVTEKDHYGRARETDSAIVETHDVRKGSHFEKFLFYRGIGNFELPIKLVALGNDKFHISNSGDEASGALILVRIEYGRVRFQRIDPIEAHTEVEATLPAMESGVDELAKTTVRELTATGLYEKEALAMVNTWRSSWFGENGTRLLYLVSDKKTDELLPLTVEPAPDEQIRVLVGRLETLTPEDGQRLMTSLVGQANAQPGADAVKTALEPLGRFAEPALKFLVGQAKDTNSRERLDAILKDVRAKTQGQPPQPVAARS